MSDFVELEGRRTRGWPWPEEDGGRTPMYGEDGWCHACGIPKHEQSGSLVLQRRSFKVHGAWVPYWRYEAYCLKRSLAEQAVAAGFDLTMLPVAWHASSPGEALQIVVPTVGGSWFHPIELGKRATARHGSPGATCPECGVWRWYPLDSEQLPIRRIPMLADDVGIIASPEWFGDGMSMLREVLVQRRLAELIVAASPRDFRIREVPVLEEG